MLVTRFHVAVAESRAAEARRCIDETRALIARLRSSGQDTALEEKSLETMVFALEHFESFVQSMQPAPDHGGPGSRAAHDLAQRISRLKRQPSPSSIRNPVAAAPGEISLASEIVPPIEGSVRMERLPGN